VCCTCFVVQDTISAIAELSRRLRLPQDKFAFAGTKDKRGVTCQLVTVHKVPIERLATVNNGSNIFFVGDATYVPQALSLGALRGNRFQVTGL
jgi:tRNA pseudouridine13 synthase